MSEMLENVFPNFPPIIGNKIKIEKFLYKASEILFLNMLPNYKSRINFEKPIGNLTIIFKIHTFQHLIL